MPTTVAAPGPGRIRGSTHPRYVSLAGSGQAGHAVHPGHRATNKVESYNHCVSWCLARCPGFRPFYVDGRWVFDLVLSNPDMVPLYRMPARQYMAYVGCAH